MSLLPMKCKSKPNPKCRLTFHPPYLCDCSSAFRLSVLKKPKWTQSLDHQVWMNHYGATDRLGLPFSKRSLDA